MSETSLFIGFMLLVLCVAALGFYWGWVSHKSQATPITTQSIEAFVTEKFPTEWKAYQMGVREGYEQGLRDGQEMPDESS
jgi:hypothetical protein